MGEGLALSPLLTIIKWVNLESYLKASVTAVLSYQNVSLSDNQGSLSSCFLCKEVISYRVEPAVVG